MMKTKKEVKKNEKALTTQIITPDVIGTFLQYMPNPDDIVAGTVESYQTYKKMLTDPRISSLVRKIKTGALLFPATFRQPKDCPDDIYNFIKEIPLFENIYRKEKRMLTSLNYGFSVSEVVWRKTEKGAFVPENIITRKPERFTFGADWRLFALQGGVRIALDQPYKFLVMRHDPDDENPYGESVLRCVYWAWMFKTAGYDFWLQATEKFSVPSLVALFQADGTDDVIAGRARSIADMLLGIESGSAAAVGNVADIKEVGMSGKLADFSHLVDACDTQICYGLTGQSIATSKTDGGSLALGEVQAEMLYEDCKGIALEVQSTIQNLVNWTVELNFGKEFVALAPRYEFDIEKTASFEQIMQAIDKGIPVSRDALYNNYGIPRPKDDGDVFIKESPAMSLSDGNVKKKLQILLSDSSAFNRERARLSELDSLVDAARSRIEKTIKATVNRYLDSVKPGLKTPSKDDLNAAFVPEYNDVEAVKQTELLIGGALLLGMSHAQNDKVEKRIAAADEIAEVKFEEAIKFLSSKVPLSKAEWNTLEPKLRFRAFTVAKLAECDYIDIVRQQLIGAVEDGIGYAGAWKRIKETVQEDALKLNPGYWENVYRTNVQSAYTAGKLMQFEKDPPKAYRLLVIEDSRTSKICRHLLKETGYGFILPTTHAFWKKYGFPPYHYQCRTGIQGIYNANTSVDTLVDNPSMKSLSKFRPLEGFGGDPLDNGSFWMMQPNQVERAIKYGILNMFNRDTEVFADYDSVWKGYKRIEGKNGGWYDLWKNPPSDWEENKPVVEHLADNGYRVKVLYDIQNTKNKYGLDWKNPDLFVDGYLSDIKQPTSINAIKDRLDSARKQGVTHVVFKIPSTMSFDDFYIGLERWKKWNTTRIDFILVKNGEIKNGHT